MYIREAHAIDSWAPAQAGPLIEDPTSDAERLAVADACVKDLGLAPIPTVVDGIDDAVNEAYSAWPDRLYLVDLQGKLAYAGGRGPFGFKPDELGAAIERELARSSVR